MVVVVEVVIVAVIMMVVVMVVVLSRNRELHPESIIIPTAPMEFSGPDDNSTFNAATHSQRGSV